MSYTLARHPRHPRLHVTHTATTPRLPTLARMASHPYYNAWHAIYQTRNKTDLPLSPLVLYILFESVSIAL